MFFLVLAFATYVLIPQFGDFRSSWSLVQHPKHPIWAWVAVAVTLLTYPLAALTYRFLAYMPLRLIRTTLVQLAAMLVNRLLPVGVGALGTNYLYLRHESHTPSQAAAVVGVNNIVGFTGHLLLLIAGLILYRNDRQLPDTFQLGHFDIRLALGIVVILLCAISWLVATQGKRLSRVIRDLRHQLTQYKTRPQALAGALASSTFLTVCYVASFSFCLLSLGINLPLIAVFLIFTVGVGVATATPTPGGLGGFEAGLAAGLVANTVPLAAAIAAALLYRLISFWLPLLAGVPAILLCQKRRLFDSPGGKH